MDLDTGAAPVDMVGNPITAGRGAVSGVIVRKREDTTMRKAERNGLYRVGKAQFRIRKGDTVPDGAELVEERAKGPAPENRMEPSAPENRDAGEPQKRKKG